MSTVVPLGKIVVFTVYQIVHGVAFFYLDNILGTQ